MKNEQKIYCLTLHEIQAELILRCLSMETFSSQRYCKECSSVLKGRRDQKFCSDYCRNQFNNRSYALHFAVQKQINRILIQNKQILAQLVVIEKKRKVQEVELQRKGFNFEFHTHQKRTKNGKVYVFCYDFGYLRLNADHYFLVQGSC